MSKKDPNEYYNNLPDHVKKMHEEHQKRNLEHAENPPKKLAGKFALATTALASATVAALFNDATAVATVSGLLTGISAPITAYTFFAEQTNC